jgi:hypothetical protein
MDTTFRAFSATFVRRHGAGPFIFCGRDHRLRDALTRGHFSADTSMLRSLRI